MPERVIAYIDGFNLYYGLRERGWRRYYWLNVQELVRRLLQGDQTLVFTRYFTSRVRRPADKNRRQTAYLEALATLSDVSIHYGHYLAERVRCHSCGLCRTAYHEKMTDVNIAVEMLTDAFADRFDMALLISADGDLVGPVDRVQRLFEGKRIVAAFPPGRNCEALRRQAQATLTIGRGVVSSSLFPDEVPKADGYILRRPAEWV